LTKAIALDDSHSEARLLRAQILLKLGDIKGAGDDCEWLMAHTENREDVLMLAARIATAKGDANAAINIYNKVTELNPSLTAAYAERGRIYYNQGQHAEAKADMLKVLELNPQQMADVSGEYSANGVEHKAKKAFSNLNPLGL
jgi:tetratricopeptide (TPR) repeat protein